MRSLVHERHVAPAAAGWQPPTVAVARRWTGTCCPSGPSRATWDGVPVLFLPLDGELEVVVYRGYEDFTSASLATARVVDLVLDLLQ